MIILAIDTSTKFLSVAITDGEKVLSSYHRQAHMNHSSRLVPTIGACLKKARLKLKDIDGFAISIGPGSFTGLRIGVTTVKTLAFILKKPVVAVPTLDAIAEGAKRFKGIICPILDAKKNKVYACFYESDGKKVKRSSKYLLIEPDRLAKKMKKYDNILRLGDGVEKDSNNWQPRAGIVAALAREKFKRRRFSNVFDLVPMYLYSRECDIKGR